MAKIFLPKYFKMEVVLKKFCSKKIDSCGLCFFVALFLMGFSIFSVSCKMTAEGIISASDDVESPILLDFSQDSAESLSLSFTEAVQLSNLEVRSGNLSTIGELVLSQNHMVVEPIPFQTSRDSQSVEATNAEAVGTCVQVVFTESQQLEMGATYIFSGIAHDQEGNSLLFQVPFYGFNRNVAGVVLSEVSSEYDKPKVEFIELYVHRSGNLAGIELYSVNKNFKYVFPAVEVSAGEYIVLHMRTLEEESGHVDELDNNLSASTASDSCTGVRDLWVSSTSEIIGTSDVLVLRERAKGKLMDALLYISPKVSDTSKKKILPAGEDVIAEGGWIAGEDGESWLSSDGMTTVNRSLSRQNILEIQQAATALQEIPVASKDAWIVTMNHKQTKEPGVTPGLPNSSTKYTK